MTTADSTSRDPWYLATSPLATRPWLIRMRWATVLVELLLLAMTFGVPQFDLPLDHIVWLVVADAFANALAARRLARGLRLPPSAATVVVAVQMLLLTALLELTGGPLNPFVKRLEALDPATLIVVLTGYGNIGGVIERLTPSAHAARRPI